MLKTKLVPRMPLYLLCVFALLAGMSGALPAQAQLADVPAPGQARVNCGSVDSLRATAAYGQSSSFLPEQYLHEQSGSAASFEQLGGSGNVLTTKRSASGNAYFTYRLPVEAGTPAPLYLSLQYRGQVRLTAGGAALLDVKANAAMSAAEFTLDDPGMWEGGYVEVKVEDAVKSGASAAHVVWIELGKTSPYRERIGHVVWDTKGIVWQVGFYDGTNREFGGSQANFAVGSDALSELATTGTLRASWAQGAIDPGSRYWLLVGVIGGSRNVIDMGNDGTAEIERSGQREVIYDLDITDQIREGDNAVGLQLAGQLDFIALIEAAPGAVSDGDLRVAFKGSQMAEDWTKLANSTMYYSNELFFHQGTGFIDASPPNGIFYNGFWMADAAPMTAEMARWGYFDEAKQATAYSKVLPGVSSATGFQDNGAAGLWFSSIAYLMKSDNYEGDYTDQMYVVLKDGMDYYCAQAGNNALGLVRGNNGETTNGEYGIYNNSIACFSLLAGAEAARNLGEDADADKWEAAAADLLAGIERHLLASEDIYANGRLIPEGTLIYSRPNAEGIFANPNAGWFGAGVQEAQYYGYRGDAVGWLRSAVDEMLKTHPALFWDDWALYGHNRGYGTSYGVLSERGGWPLNAMFMSDEMDMAKKNLQHVIYNSSDIYFENDNEGVAEISPWVLVREVNAHDHGITGADVGNGGAVEDMNLVEFAVTMTNIRLMAGIDDSLEGGGALAIIPRLPREWGGAKVNEWPAVYKDAGGYKKTLVSYDYDFGRLGASMTVSAGDEISGVQLRLGPFDKGLGAGAVSVDGATMLSVGDRGDSSWVWVQADIGAAPKTIAVTLALPEADAYDRFDEGMGAWSAKSGAWSASGGELSGRDGVLLGGKADADFDGGYAFSADVTLSAAASAAGIVVGADASGDGGYELALDKAAAGEGEIALTDRASGEKLFSAAMNVCVGRAYNLKLETANGALLLYLDGVRVGVSLAPGGAIAQGAFGLAARESAVFDNAYARALDGVAAPQISSIDLKMEVAAGTSAAIMAGYPVKLLAVISYDDGTKTPLDARFLEIETDDPDVFQFGDGCVTGVQAGSGDVWAAALLPDGSSVRSNELALSVQALPPESVALLDADFEDGDSSEWTTTGGTAIVEGGNLAATHNNDSWTLHNGLSVRDFIMSADVALRSGNAVGVSFRVSGAAGSSGYDVILDRVDGLIKLCTRPYAIISSASMKVELDKPYHLTVQAEGQAFTVFLNGVKMIERTHSTSDARWVNAGKAGLYAFKSTASADHLRVGTASEVVGLSLAADSGTLFVGLPVRLTLNGALANGDVARLDPDVAGIALESSDIAILEVEGLSLTPKAAGSVTVTASGGGLASEPLAFRVEVLGALAIVERLATDNNPAAPDQELADNSVYPTGLRISAKVKAVAADGELIDLPDHPDLALAYISSAPGVASYAGGALNTMTQGYADISARLDIAGEAVAASEPIGIMCFDPQSQKDAYFDGDFADGGLDDWFVPAYGGANAWEASGRRLAVTSAGGGDNWYIYRPAIGSDFAYSADITLTGAGSSVGMCFRMNESNTQGGYDIVLERLTGGAPRLGFHRRPYAGRNADYLFDVQTNRTYRVTVIAKGNSFKVYLDGELKLNLAHNEYSSGRFGVFYYNQAHTGGYLENMAISPIPQFAAAPAVDRAALAQAIEDAEAIDLSGYTPGSAADLLEAILEAKGVLDDAGATQAEVDAAEAALASAVAALAEREAPGDRLALESLLANAAAIGRAAFTPESAAALDAAVLAAEALLEDAQAAQGALDAAAGAVEAAIGGLVPAGGLEDYEPLIDLLLEYAKLDSSLYTPASWQALADLMAEAWQYVLDEQAAAQAGAPAVPGEPSDPQEPEEPGESGVPGDPIGPLGAPAEPQGKAEILALEAGQELAPMATSLKPEVRDWIIRLVEKRGELVLVPTAALGPQKDITAGVYAVSATKELIAEYIDGAATAEFTVSGLNLQNVGIVVLNLSVKDAAAGAPALAIPDGLKGADKERDDDDLARIAHYEDITPEDSEDGYRTYSVQIHATGKDFSVADGEPILEVSLPLKENVRQAVSLLLGKLDIVFYDSGFENGETGIQAIERISPPAASALVLIRSRFDVNLDGEITLLDVNLVRQNLGAAADGQGNWPSEAAMRCDLGGDDVSEPGKDLPDGRIDTRDLTLVIAKYMRENGI